MLEKKKGKVVLRNLIKEERGGKGRIEKECVVEVGVGRRMDMQCRL